VLKLHVHCFTTAVSAAAAAAGGENFIDMARWAGVQ
jgi:hypothetical protein